MEFTMKHSFSNRVLIIGSLLFCLDATVPSRGVPRELLEASDFECSLCIRWGAWRLNAAAMWHSFMTRGSEKTKCTSVLLVGYPSNRLLPFHIHHIHSIIACTPSPWGYWIADQAITMDNLHVSGFYFTVIFIYIVFPGELISLFISLPTRTAACCTVHSSAGRWGAEGISAPPLVSFM